MLWIIAFFFSVAGETQFCLDQVALSGVKWQGDNNAHLFLAQWYETLHQLRHAPQPEYLRETFFNECRKSTQLLRHTFEEIDLKPLNAHERTYEFLKDRLEHLLEINRDKANRQSVLNPSSSAQRAGAAGADPKRSPKPAPKGNDKGGGKGGSTGSGPSAMKVCFKWNYGICQDPCPNNREHRKPRNDAERAEYKKLKAKWDEQAAAKRAADKEQAPAVPPRSPSPAGGKAPKGGKAKGKGKDSDGKGKSKRGRSPSPEAAKHIFCKAPLPIKPCLGACHPLLM